MTATEQCGKLSSSERFVATQRKATATAKLRHATRRKAKLRDVSLRNATQRNASQAALPGRLFFAPSHYGRKRPRAPVEAGSTAVHSRVQEARRVDIFKRRNPYRQGIPAPLSGLKLQLSLGFFCALALALALFAIPLDIWPIYPIIRIDGYFGPGL